jgi:amidase
MRSPHEILVGVSTVSESELVFAGPAELAGRIRAGDLSARELVEACLRRIEALDPHLNAFRVVLAEEALAAAEAPVDGPLAGVPFAVKDDLALAGQARTQGSRSTAPPASADAEAVRRLRAAGAIPIGVTNVPELMIFPWTVSEANGVTRNPWDPSRTPGGSSGGSAAAVAAGLVPFATGSDGGGSIRIPAAACGLVGMKPSRGRVSTQPAGESWLGLSVYGALARTVADSALLLDVMQGAIAGDLEFVAPYTGSYREAAARPPGRLRIAISKRLPPGLLGKLSADQRRAWDETAHALESLGHDVEERDPRYGLAQLHFLQMWVRGIYEESLMIAEPDRLEPLTRQMAAQGRWLVPPRRRARLIDRREIVSARIMALWDEFDVLLTPGLARTAIDAEGGFGRPAPMAIDIGGRFTPYTPVFNVTGQPAIALPAGIGSDGMPLSVQLVGRRGAEALLYSLAGQLEAARPWAERRPPLSGQH